MPRRKALEKSFYVNSMPFKQSKYIHNLYHNAFLNQQILEF